MARANKKTLDPRLMKAALPVCTVLFFLTVCLTSIGTVKETAIFSILLSFAGGAFCFSRLRQRITLPVIAMALFVLMGGISTFYALAGKFALQEFLKVLISFCLAIFMLAATPGEGAAPGRRIASVLEGCTALAGLFSIDLLSTHLLSTPFLKLMIRFCEEYTAIDGVEIGTRMTSIFQNPNVFAGCAGIGVLLSLGLVLSSASVRERIIHLICLFVNALSFLLAFSMGAIAFIAVAFVVYLILERTERRASLFILMLETLAVTLAATVLIASNSLDAWDGVDPLPLLCVVIGSTALCVCDCLAGRKLGEKLAGHGKAMLGVIAGSMAVLAVFAVAALSLTGPITLESGETLRRSAYPAPGSYTISAEGGSAVSVTIESQNEQDTMMHTSTRLYSGPLSEASFTVPEDSLVVYFNFRTSETTDLASVACEGTETVSIPLDYKLLPGFIANRLQGLRANQNAIQRTVFFEDGMKLFLRSPVVGLGMGSYESAIKSVQSFLYETKYAHNHYIQALLETGIIGLILFVVLLASCAAAVLFELRKGTETHPLAVSLAAALVFMAGHAFVEVIFSFYAYLPIAFGVFALIALCCGDAIPAPKLTSGIKTGVVCACAGLVALFSVFLFQNVSAGKLVETQPSMQSLAKAAEMDRFEYADYMLSFVVNAGNFPDNSDIQQAAFAYALRLSRLDSNTIPFYLAEYFFGIDDTARAIEMLEKYLHYMSSDSNAWEKAFLLLAVNAESSDIYYDGLCRIVALKEEWERNNMGTITLSETALQLLDFFELGKD